MDRGRSTTTTPDPVDGPVCLGMVHNSDTRHVFHVNLLLGECVRWIIRRRQRGNTTQDGLVALTRPPPPAVWHGRCATTRSDIRSLPTTLVWYDMAGECVPRPAETDRQLPPGIIATSGKCLLVSTIGPTTTINLLCEGWQVEVLVLGCPGSSPQHRPSASCCQTLSHGIGHQPAFSTSMAAAQRQK